MSDTPAAADPGRVTWAGRDADAVPGAIDGWNTSREGLLSALAGAEELVVLDALSFPWEQLGAAHRDIPVLLVTPEELDAAAVLDVLGAPVLHHLTPWDRVVASREEALDLLGTPADPARANGKARFNRLVEACATEVRAGLAGYEPGTGVVETWGVEDGLLARLVPALDPGTTVTDGALTEGPAAADIRPSPHAALVLLRAGASPQDRAVTVREALARLVPGGALVVVADVVTELDAPVAPSISQLLEEIHHATGMAVSLEELRSLRWPGDSRARSVALRFSSLRRADEDEEGTA